MRAYRPGTILYLHGRFRRAGRPFDPDRVEVTIARPRRRRRRRLEYGRDPEVTRLGPGHYEVIIRPEVTGEWSYAWTCYDKPAPTFTQFLVAESDE